jgi:hypothetical protein
MKWLTLAFALELGILPMSSWVMYDPPATVQEQPEFYQQFEARAILWDHLFLGGDVRIYDWMAKEEISFWPSRGAFTLNAGVAFGDIELGFRHYCTHPIVPYMPIQTGKAKWEGAYEEIYLRLEVRTP